jgi:hypothetical protein
MEIWTPAYNYPDYEVSTLGNIRTKYGDPVPVMNSHRYKKVYLHNNNGSKIECLHKLILQSFVPNNNPHRTQCDHINRIQSDNRLDNLRWATHRENNGNKVSNGVQVIVYNDTTYYYARIETDGRFYIIKADSYEEAIAIYRAMHIDKYGEFSPYYLGDTIDE